MLITGISSVGAETTDTQEADLRVIAVPDRIETGRLSCNSAPVDNPTVAPNACLLIAEVTKAADLRVFWDIDEDIGGEADLLYQLGDSNCFPLTLSDARKYLDDIDKLIARLRSPHFLVFLLLLPESWTAHHFSVDILSTQPSSPADEIPSRRAVMVSTFIPPGRTDPCCEAPTRDRHSGSMGTDLDAFNYYSSGSSESDLYMSAGDSSAGAGVLAWSEILTKGANF